MATACILPRNTTQILTFDHLCILKEKERSGERKRERAYTNNEWLVTITPFSASILCIMQLKLSFRSRIMNEENEK